MSEDAARYQALAVAGGAVTVFIGVCHETVGTALFPWGPALFGGTLPWNALGIGCIALGLALMAGSLRLVRFPVAGAAAVMVVPALGIAVFTAVSHGMFHVFAVALAVCGVMTAYCYRRMVVLGG